MAQSAANVIQNQYPEFVCNKFPLIDLPEFYSTSEWQKGTRDVIIKLVYQGILILHREQPVK